MGEEVFLTAQANVGFHSGMDVLGDVVEVFGQVGD